MSSIFNSFQCRSEWVESGLDGTLSYLIDDEHEIRQQISQVKK